MKSAATIVPNYASVMEYRYHCLVSCGTFPYFEQTARSRSDNSWVHNSRHAMRLLLLPLSTPNFKHSSCSAHNRPMSLHPLSYSSQNKSTHYLLRHFLSFSGISLCHKEKNRRKFKYTYLIKSISSSSKKGVSPQSHSFSELAKFFSRVRYTLIWRL